MGPSAARFGGYAEYEFRYEIAAVFRVRRVATADPSLADILDLRRFGIAIAAMTKMIATTINNSINEKPLCLRRILEFSIYEP
jgi:hypothetical protein